MIRTTPASAMDTRGRDPAGCGSCQQGPAGERDGRGGPGLHGEQPRQHGLERIQVEGPAEQDGKAERERYQPACSRDC